jgi:hypothetical protein
MLLTMRFLLFFPFFCMNGQTPQEFDEKGNAIPPPDVNDGEIPDILELSHLFEHAGVRCFPIRFFPSSIPLPSPPSFFSGA